MTPKLSPFKLRSTQASSPPGAPLSPGATPGVIAKPSVSFFHKLPTLTSTNENAPAGSPHNGDTPPQDLPQSEDFYAQGVKDGEQRAAQMYQDTIKLLESVIETINSQHEKIKCEIEASHLLILSQCMEIIFPRLAHMSAEAQILEILRSLGSPLIEGPIEIFANTDTARNVEKLLDKALPSLTNLSILEDDDMSPMAVRAQWAHGGLLLDPRAPALECLDIIKTALAAVHHEQA